MKKKSIQKVEMDPKKELEIKSEENVSRRVFITKAGQLVGLGVLAHFTLGIGSAQAASAQAASGITPLCANCNTACQVCLLCDAFVCQACHTGCQAVCEANCQVCNGHCQECMQCQEPAQICTRAIDIYE